MIKMTTNESRPPEMASACKTSFIGFLHNPFAPQETPRTVLAQKDRYGPAALCPEPWSDLESYFKLGQKFRTKSLECGMAGYAPA
jgi:hypothetical protein